MGRIAHPILLVVVAVIMLTTVNSWLSAANDRLNAQEAEKVQGAARAAAADEGYCTPELKQILKRVLTSCGLVSEGQKRGCQPLQAKQVASMSGDDFNALFKPLASRAAIIQFELDKSEMTEAEITLLDQTFANQQGASYFLVVSRASPEGSVEHNRELSEARAASVLNHLKQKYQDPDLEHEVGLLWLGEEFAQLSGDFCAWNRSRPDEVCSPSELNRSAFIAWIDCRL